MKKMITLFSLLALLAAAPAVAQTEEDPGTCDITQLFIDKALELCPATTVEGAEPARNFGQFNKKIKRLGKAANVLNLELDVRTLKNDCKALVKEAKKANKGTNGGEDENEEESEDES